MDQPTIFQRLEGVFLFFVAILFYFMFQNNAWLYFGLLFVPDISALGYLAGNKIGSHTYNIGHSLIAPLVLLGIGVAGERPLVTAVALIWVAHIGLDRALGFGLKFSDSFSHTHLGRIGKPKH